MLAVAEGLVAGGSALAGVIFGAVVGGVVQWKLERLELLRRIEAG